MATVLVVEDDRLSQRLLGKILGGAGHTLLPVETAQAAWEILVRPTLADLVILDNQLAGGWGWELLERIRADVVFRSLPVVVYTGHTERSSILKYVELGVQGMLVKPYRADVILSEVNRAVAADWIGRLIDPPDVACRRLGINEPDYYSLLGAVATSLEGDIQTLREAVRNRTAALRSGEQLQRIFNQSASLGMPALKTTAEELEKAIERRQMPEIQTRLSHLESILRMLRHRANVYLGVKEMSAPAAARPAAQANVAAPAGATTGGSGASPLALFVRRTAAAPLWEFGAHVARVRDGRFVDPEELRGRFVEGERPAVLTAFLEGFGYLRSLPYIGLDALTEQIRAMEGYEALYLSISRRVGSIEEDANLDTELAIQRLGVDRTGVLLTCARLARQAQVASPLNLGPLLQHTLSVTILSYEIAHSLRVNDEHLAASAGLAHDVGTWILALGEPALYGLALALALQRDGGVAAAEKDILGLSHEELGGSFLSACGAPELLQEAAQHHARPEVASSGHIAVLAAVALADQLTWAATAESADQASAARAALIDGANPVWAALKRAGVALPMDVPELIDSLHAIAKSSLAVSSTLATWAKGPQA